jgi:hypothetical protein
MTEKNIYIRYIEKKCIPFQKQGNDRKEYRAEVVSKHSEGITEGKSVIGLPFFQIFFQKQQLIGSPF